MNYAVGVVLLAMAGLLIYLGRPDKDGNSPKFLRFNAAPVLYPPVILVFCAFGAVMMFYTFL